MKNLILILLVMLMAACSPYKVFIPVKSFTAIPENTKTIVISQPITAVKKAFIKSGIMVKSFEGGFETEEIIIDEGTRAMYKIHDFENTSQISAFWGITQKVKSNITVWAGAAAAAAYETDTWDRVIYTNPKGRPERVFHYALQITEDNNLDYSLK